MRRVSGVSLGICCLFMLPNSGVASETTNMQYDALGRLISSSNTGGPRNGRTTATTYDDAGNRRAQAVGVALPAPANASTFVIVGPSAPVAEGGQAVFTITRTGTAQGDMTVGYTSGNNSASAPGDFAAVSGNMLFRAWETTKNVVIPILDDQQAEGAEQFSLSLHSPSAGGTIGTITANTIIASSGPANQPPVTVADSVSVGVCSATERNVLANDSDPEGNVPLTITAVTSNNRVQASVSGAGIMITAFGTPGNTSVTYTVRDSLGATSSGTLYISVLSGSGCD